MKEIVAKNQVELGSARCIQLALSGIMFRLFRSSITIVILGLAVAFLAHMLAYSVISGTTERAIWAELEAERSLGVRLRRLESPDAFASLLLQFQKQDAHRLAEYSRWGALSASEMEQTLRRAALVADFERAVQNFTNRQRAILAGDRNAIELLEYIVSPEALNAFLERCRQIEVRSPLGSREALETLVTVEWPALQEVLHRVREGHRRAVAQLERELEGQRISDALIQTPEEVKGAAEAVGFYTAAYDFDRLAAFARDARHQRRVEESIGSLRIRQSLAGRLNVPPVEIHSLRVMEWIAENKDHAAELDQLLGETEGVEAIGADNLYRVATHFLKFRRLQSLVPIAPDLDAEDRFFGLDQSGRWLILLAFLVCVIGVANAMLMSVTERFTEIATMKCLGAMDKFIMMMFVFEAAIQGLVGGIFGALFGVFLAWVRGVSEFGGTLVLAGVFGTVLLSALLALTVGILLAVLAAVGPSFAAARLAPMEAMRVE
ncbi:MAG: ABC transporter permease [Verrucomicrobia bacterium]|nr:ABC transporter permease [Verrucomicrobiota bacterium]MCH8510928.1 ABC transporter permease [Kiritimatiellia bacterium]